MEVRTKLKLRCASLQIPIGLGPKLQGFIDIVDSKAYYFHKFGSFEVPKLLQSLVSGKERELIKLLSKVDQRFIGDSPSDLKGHSSSTVCTCVCRSCLGIQECTVSLGWYFKIPPLPT